MELHVTSHSLTIDTVPGVKESKDQHPRMSTPSMEPNLEMLQKRWEAESGGPQTQAQQLTWYSVGKRNVSGNLNKARDNLQRNSISDGAVPTESTLHGAHTHCLPVMCLIQNAQHPSQLTPSWVPSDPPPTLLANADTGLETSPKKPGQFSLEPPQNKNEGIEAEAAWAQRLLQYRSSGLHQLCTCSDSQSSLFTLCIVPLQQRDIQTPPSATPSQTFLSKPFQEG
ncbi:hypothetical protein P7K49_035374 [Saguinus oedipus]|uniref:Uncharacterized protein n=1 Tax=Saguinus oedipus TaxID=9490 RepID=A0ABQ9TMF3_SAGOE|nr:hypothetical protein P7K49_035374 [Saguinus oedipus]